MNSTPTAAPVTSRTSWRDAPTQTVRAGATDFAYRELGPRGGVPLVLLHHLNAVMDDWDPEVLDALAQQRHVIAFDNRGVGRSNGRTPSTVGEMAADAVRFIGALGHKQVDLLGFSLGGGVAQFVLIGHPALVRRAVLAGTGPAGAGGLAKMPLIAGSAYAKAGLTLRDPRHFLFFHRNAEGKQAATEYMARIKAPKADPDKANRPQVMAAQLRAIVAAGKQAPHDLGRITQPVLVANGDHDVMVASSHSEDLARRIPGAELIMYPDCGHGGVFQHRDHFVPAVLAFLDADAA